MYHTVRERLMGYSNGGIILLGDFERVEMPTGRMDVVNCHYVVARNLCAASTFEGFITSCG